MQPDGRAPLSVRFCQTLVQAAAEIIPLESRAAWQNRWFIDIHRRWTFLRHSGFWNKHEALLLCLYCLHAIPESLRMFLWQDAVRSRALRVLRSPWTCIGFLSACLVVVAVLTGGLGATRALLRASSGAATDRVLFIWRHPVIGGGDRGFPSDVVPGWARNSQELEQVAPFQIARSARSNFHGASAPLAIQTEASLFSVLHARVAFGKLPYAGQDDAIILDWKTWKTLFRSNRNVIGSLFEFDGRKYLIAAVLSPEFSFISRCPAIYLVQKQITASPVMVVARVKPSVSNAQVDRELTKIAEDDCYYFYSGQLRIRSFRTSLLTPFLFFTIAALVSALLSAVVLKVRPRTVFLAWKYADKSSVRRAIFITVKTGLALAIVFTVGLEWSRSETSLLFASKDPANGPFLVWFYVAGAMAVFFWAIADQRLRCRQCLRSLGFPVRIGTPGSFFLTWSGTELICLEGHGVLHVPLLAPSWDEESEHWISLDDSWRSLFTS